MFHLNNTLRFPLLFGGSGCLGSALQVELQNRDIAYDLFKRIVDKDNLLRIRELDFRQYSSVIYVAQSREYKSYPEGIPDLTLVNIYQPLLLSILCREHGIPFVFTSTGGVYGPSNTTLSERADLITQNSLSPYIASKFFAEQTLIGYSENVLILRPFFIYGPNARMPSLFPTLLKLIKESEVVNLKGELGLEFNPISSRDAARAILHLLDAESFGVYNLGGMEISNLRKISEIIGDVVGLEPKFLVSDGSEKILSDQSKLLETGFLFEDKIAKNFRDYIENEN